MNNADLSFTVQIVRNYKDLRDACGVRASAYGHHVPQLQRALAEPDATDTERGSAIMLCRDKATGAPVGTARVLRSSHTRLQLEGSVRLPEWLSHQPRAEITRLAVVPGADPLVRLALMKSTYLYCMATQIRWMVIGARSEALIRIYRRLGFSDALEDGAWVKLSHAGDLPHNILAFDVLSAERTWREAGHGLYPFMIESFHRDIKLFEDVPAALGGWDEDLLRAA